MTSNVIVIDDDPDTREILSEFLRLKSINVLATGNDGKDAVELYQKYRPDVVLMDLIMPDFDGLYGLKNIRKLDSNANVIILTGNIEYNLSKELIKSRASATLIKPYDMKYLVKIIDKISPCDSIQESQHNSLRFTCNRL